MNKWMLNSFFWNWKISIFKYPKLNIFFFKLKLQNDSFIDFVSVCIIVSKAKQMINSLSEMSATFFLRSNGFLFYKSLFRFYFFFDNFLDLSFAIVHPGIALFIIFCLCLFWDWVWESVYLSLHPSPLTQWLA